MMFSSPFFDGYGNNPLQYEEPSYYSRRRYHPQMRAAEEAERQRRARQEYLRQVEEEEAYRKAYEAAKRRREMEEARQVQEYLYGNSEYGNNWDDDESEEEEEEIEMEPVYRVMQGPHGQLYKVKVGERPRSQPKPTPRRGRTTNSEGSYQLVRGPNGRIYRVQLGEEKEEAAKKQKETKQQQQIEEPTVPSWFPRVNDDGETDRDEENEAAPSMRIPIRSSLVGRRRSSGKKKKKKQKVTVVVEDASDSESEEDEYKSAWRNRRPSPGEWMEPVSILRA